MHTQARAYASLPTCCSWEKAAGRGGRSRHWDARRLRSKLMPFTLATHVPLELNIRPPLPLSGCSRLWWQSLRTAVWLTTEAPTKNSLAHRPYLPALEEVAENPPGKARCLPYGCYLDSAQSTHTRARGQHFLEWRMTKEGEISSVRRKKQELEYFSPGRRTLSTKLMETHAPPRPRGICLYKALPQESLGHKSWGKPSYLE